MVMISGHVPAWKRVGLTLKYQPLVVNPVPVDTIVPITSQKRLWKIEHDKAPETKRSRQNPTHSHIAEASSASTPLLGPEKSYRARPPSPSTGDNIEKSAFEKVGTAAHETPSTALPPFLRYLHNYVDDRIHWKFNKAHQTHLLKNAFNLYRIPNEYDEALYQYIAGLNGDSARNRLLATAQGILDNQSADAPQGQRADPATATDDARIAAHIKDKKVVRSALPAQEKQIAPPPNDEIKALQRCRAERVIHALHPERIDSKKMKQATQTVDKTKSRTRTAIGADDDNSSISNSSINNSSSNDDSINGNISNDSDSSGSGGHGSDGSSGSCDASSDDKEIT